jgi:hypothetical protein
MSFEFREVVKAVPLHHKRTIQSVANALRIPKSSLFDMKNDKGNDAVIMQVSFATKPMLTEEHKAQRVF